MKTNSTNTDTAALDAYLGVREDAAHAKVRRFSDDFRTDYLLALGNEQSICDAFLGALHLRLIGRVNNRPPGDALEFARSELLTATNLSRKTHPLAAFQHEETVRFWARLVAMLSEK